MSINVTARHFDLKEEAREYFIQRMREIMESLEHATNCNVIINKDKHEYEFEIHLHVSHKDFIAKVRAVKLSKAFHDAIDKLGIQLRKYFDKKNLFENISLSDIPMELE